MKSLKIKFKSLLIFLSVIILTEGGCTRNHYKVDISGIETDLKISRLEQDLFSVNPNEIVSKIPELKASYGRFLQLFSYVINIGEITDSTWSNDLVSFCTDKLNYEVYENVKSVFPDITQLEDAMNDAFRHYLYYFPAKPVPKVYTCITGFNNSLITMQDTILAIGLDRYLGADSKYYQQLQIYSYQSAKMTPAKILTDAMYGWGSVEFEFGSAGYPDDNVLAEIIHEGKLLYFVKCMLPGEPDEMIFGFTGPQLEFCRNNESQMWQYMVENNLLFVTDQLVKRKLTGDAPFTGYFTSESPGRAAVWIGFRIIESYMQNNGNIGLDKLMGETDIQAILEGARYNPR